MANTFPEAKQPPNYEDDRIGLETPKEFYQRVRLEENAAAQRLQDEKSGRSNG